MTLVTGQRIYFTSLYEFDLFVIRVKVIYTINQRTN